MNNKWVLVIAIVVIIGLFWYFDSRSVDLSPKPDPFGERAITHLECDGFKCAIVEGKGIDECVTHADCVPPKNETNNTGGNGGGRLPGNETNMTEEGSSHMACVGFQCMIIPFFGNTTCETDTDCNVTQSIQTQPDLIISKLEVIFNNNTMNITNGSITEVAYEYEIKATVTNIGGSYSPPSYTQLLMSPLPADEDGEENIETGWLMPYESILLMKIFNFYEGDYSATAEADYLDDVIEFDELNNFYVNETNFTVP